MNDSSKRPRARSPWTRPAVLLILAVLIGGTIVWQVVLPARRAAKGLRLVEAKNVALAHLENETERGDGYATADQQFQEIIEQVADEPLGWQNLAVCRLLSFRAKNSGGSAAEAKARDEAFALAAQAIEGLLEVQPSSVAYWLRAQLLLGMFESTGDAGLQDDAVLALHKAVELAPEDPIFSAALYSALKFRRSNEDQAAAVEAMRGAFEQLPSNLFLLTEWLDLQTQREDPAIVTTLQSARPVLQPLQASIQRRGIDIMPLLEQAIAAAENGDWATVRRNVVPLRNSIRPEEVAKADYRRLNAHPLEFLVHDFSAEFYRRFRPAWLKTGQPIEVRFAGVEAAALNTIATARDVLLRDVDLDGQLELVVLTADELVVLRWMTDLVTWRELGRTPLAGDFTSILSADLDRDLRQSAPGDAAAALPVAVTGDTCFEADPDFVLYGPSGVLVLRTERQQADPEVTFTRVDQAINSESFGEATCGALVDFDHDSDLDLVVAAGGGVRLLSNRGNGSLLFDDVSQWSLLPPATGEIQQLLPVDWDRDVDIDIIVVRPGQSLGLLANMRHGQFRWEDFDPKLLGERPPSVSCVSVLEADGNASWDLAWAGNDGVHLALTTTPKAGTVLPLRASRLIESNQVDGVRDWDYDNDGHRDLVFWGTSGVSMLRGEGEGRFAEQPRQLSDQPASLVRCGDLDNDGDLDLIGVESGKLRVWENDGGNQNHWLSLRALGRADNISRVNHHGIGSLAELRAGTLYQAQVVQTPRTHFGIGSLEHVDVMRVVWTNGVPQNLVQPQLDAIICEPMFLKGSCPYLYTWDGQRFAFLTDCLWAAPIGLQSAEGITVPTRSWEYLKIPGERLRARDGEYQLQVTEELWEAAYFDHLQLTAIDHPEGTEIYSNEKVGPPEVARFKIHTVKNRRQPVSVVDQQGRNVWPQVRERDNDFAKCFDRREQQGLVDEHYLEVDLGELDQPRQLTLFLTGWIRPTDTSLNIAFSQNDAWPAPQLPSVWVPDAKGVWRQSIAYMGFPGGKTKTIAVDLSEAFLTNDYRVRIATTAEIYWDEVFFTVDDAEVVIRQTPLELISGNLHHRGFSRRIPHGGNAPDTYDYATLDTQPRWPPMRGNFTRYGDVTELLRASDDRMAVLASGDEMTVRFGVPREPLPEGWRRDFILHCVGWDKDADLNTVYGQEVDPLPFREMKSYPYAIDEQFPTSTRHAQYLRQYQTRRVNFKSFWNAVRCP